jgi:predicted DNA-binding protein (UPF0251 family)
MCICTKKRVAVGRCKKQRCCRFLSDSIIFKPIAVPLKAIELSDVAADEFEAIRLCDHEKKSQIEAAQVMRISRGTVQRLLESGRYKIINAFLNAQGIRIQNNN